MLLALACALAQAAGEETMSDDDYAKHVVRFVKQCEALQKGWKAAPAESLKVAEALIREIEAELAPRFPRHIETTIAVKITKGIDRGDIKERVPFHPYRLAGEVALGAGKPDLAVRWLARSPSSAALLAEAKKALEARPPPLQRPAGPDLAGFLAKQDFAGALEALRPERERLGKEYEGLVSQVRAAALRHQKDRTTAFATALPRLEEANFRDRHVEPCLKDCARVPAEFEGEELAWTRRLGAWTVKKDAAEFDALALSSAKFDPAFHAVLRIAQERRIREIEKVVEDLARVARAERAPLLERLSTHTRAFQTLAAAKDSPDLREDLARLERRLPIDDEALDAARKGATAPGEIRALADRLERLWSSERRLRLSAFDQDDLSLYAGLYRCLSLFLDGMKVEEAARDARVREWLKSPHALPKEASPKVAAVRARLK